MRDLVSKRAYNKAYRQAHRAELSAKKKIYCQTHKDEVRARHKAWYQTHYEEIRAKQKVRYRANLERASAYGKRWWLKRAYQLTLKERDEMLKAQGGTCAICGKTEWGKHSPTVDHDHITGAIRGILCVKCNAAIGLLGDKANTAYAAAVYLRDGVRRLESET